MAITHATVATAAEPTIPAEIGGNQWNANHTIDAGTITDTHVAAANKDGVTGTASLRTLGAGAQQAAAGDHTHPGGSEAFPVGAVFIAIVSTNPATLLGYGTWSAIAAGRMLIGLDAGDADFDTDEETGGAKTITLSSAEMPAHTHGEQRFPTTTGGSSGFTADTSMSGTPTAVTQTTASTGGGGAHNNMPPYFVCRIWKRTA